MNKKDMPDNTIYLAIKYMSPDTFQLSKGYKFDDDLSDEIMGYMLALLDGMHVLAEIDQEVLMKAGYYAHMGSEILASDKDSEESEIPDGTNIHKVDFKGKIQ